MDTVTLESRGLGCMKWRCLLSSSNAIKYGNISFYYTFPAVTNALLLIPRFPCSPSRLKHLLVVSIFVPSLHSNKHPNLHSQILILHQRTLESLSLVTSVLLRKHDQSNQYQHSNSNNGTHNHKRHSSSPFPPILTHRP